MREVHRAWGRHRRPDGRVARAVGTIAVALIGTVGAVSPAGAEGTGSGTLTGIPGLYATSSVAIAATPGGGALVSDRSCDDVQEVLTDGDWSLLESFDLPTAKAAGLTDRFLRLGRGDARATARLREATGTCTGWVWQAPERPFQLSGQRDVDATATMLPLICARLGDGQVQVSGLYEVGGGWLASLAIAFVPADGVRPIKADAFGANPPGIARSDRSLFEALGADKEPRFDELDPGPRFRGTIETASSTGVLSAHVSLAGLLDGRGRDQGVDAWIDCPLREGAAPRDPLAPGVAVGGPVTLHAEIDDRVRITGSAPVTSQQTVTIDATLAPVTEGRWEGTGTAFGTGRFKEPDLSDFKGSCSTSWTGTQPVSLVLTADASSAQLALTLAGPPEVDQAKPCNQSTHGADPGFPWSTIDGQRVDLRWPPGTADTDRQVVRQRIPGLGSLAWTITFATAP